MEDHALPEGHPHAAERDMSFTRSQGAPFPPWGSSALLADWAANGEQRAADAGAAVGHPDSRLGQMGMRMPRRPRAMLSAESAASATTTAAIPGRSGSRGHAGKTIQAG